MTIEKVTIREHLNMLDQNATVCEREAESLCRRMQKKFELCGYSEASKDPSLIKEFVQMIFETQGFRCTHWIQTEGDQLNGVWNRPCRGYLGWKTKDVKYEIDHVNPINAGGLDKLENYQFLSANANQFTKCSLTYDDLLRRVDLSAKLKKRIRSVLAKRRKLFRSKKWKEYIARLEALENRTKNVLDKQ
jgi:hypothetical protein